MIEAEEYRIVIAEIERIKCGNGNCYIVSNGSNAVLIDTNQRKYREKILNACKQYNIRLIILTHGHLDHAQNAAFISDQLNVPVAMHKNDIGLISNNMTQPMNTHTFLGKIVWSVSQKKLNSNNIPVFTPEVFLKEGDTLDDYGISAQIIELPGHTDGSIGIDIEEKYLIVGDALMNMFYPTVSMLYHNKDLMLQSAGRISQLGNRIIYFGHGKPVSNRSWVSL